MLMQFCVFSLKWFNINPVQHWKKIRSFNVDFDQAFAQNAGFSLVFVSLWCSLIYRVYVLLVFHFVHCIPRVYVIPIVEFCRHPKSLLQETIDPDTSPGSLLSLLAMLLHRYYKLLLRSMLVSKTRLKLHATCGVYVMPVFHCCSWYPQGLCYPHFLTCRFFYMFLQEKIDLDQQICSPGSTFKRRFNVIRVYVCFR